MKIFFLFFLLMLGAGPALGDAVGAQQVIDGYEREVAAWGAKVNAAKGVEERRALLQVVPDSDAFGMRLLQELDGSWNQDWFLDYAPKLLGLAPAFAVKPLPGAKARTPLSAVRESAERFHFESSKIGPLTMALIIDNGPKTRKFLEKVESIHPDPQVQGQAAMALALLSREMGNGGNIVQFKEQRIQWVRKAIIQADKVPFGGTTIGAIAEDFVFAISHLDKGMEAPDILGWNVEKQAMRLSDSRGKPTIIVFWHNRMPAADKTLAFLQRTEERLGRRGLVVVGAASESQESLRAMVKDGSVTWKNWIDDEGKIAKLYQITNYPACWVLDAEGKVAFRGVPGPFAELTAEALVKELERK